MKFVSLQGRGGPGMTTNVGMYIFLGIYSFAGIQPNFSLNWHIADPQKQVGGLAVLGESVQQQPIGLHLAITAAAQMAGALGGVQAGLQPNQSALPSQLVPASDPLTLHLAKMSRNQLNEIMSGLKVRFWPIHTITKLCTISLIDGICFMSFFNRKWLQKIRN